MITISGRRKELGLTQENLANALGISRQSLSAIERGSEQPRIGLAINLSRALGMSVEELFGGRESLTHSSAHNCDTARVGAYGEFNDGLKLRALPTSNVDGFWQSPNGITFDGQNLGRRLGPPGIFFDGCDPILGMLASYLSRRLETQCFWWSVPNKVAQGNLISGRTHVALVHTPCDQTPVESQSSGIDFYPLVDWDLCIATKPGNPLKLKLVKDVFSSGAKIAKRVKGSGVRERYDRWSGDDFNDDSLEVDFESHLDACNAVRYGNYDVTFAMGAIATSAQLDVIPVAIERSWLAVRRATVTDVMVARILNEISTTNVRSIIDCLPQYKSVG